MSLAVFCLPFEATINPILKQRKRDCTREQMKEERSEKKGGKIIERIKHVFLFDVVAL